MITIRRSRTSDPITSKLGSEDVARRAPSQSMRLLLAYSQAKRGLTADEAAELTGLLRPGVCYWKRCSELRDNGWIKSVIIGDQMLTRQGTSGSQQMICCITDEGREILKQKGLL